MACDISAPSKETKVAMDFTAKQEPFCLVLPEETDPPVKHGVGDPETGAEFLYSPQMKEVFADDTQDM